LEFWLLTNRHGGDYERGIPNIFEVRFYILINNVLRFIFLKLSRKPRNSENEKTEKIGGGHRAYWSARMDRFFDEEKKSMDGKITNLLDLARNINITLLENRYRRLAMESP